MPFNKVKKLVHTIGSRSPLEGFKYLFNAFTYTAGLRESETYILRRQLPDMDKQKVIDLDYDRGKIKVVVARDHDDLKAFKSLPDAFFLTPFDAWFSRGSVCLLVGYQDEAIAYSWIHKHCYDWMGIAGSIYLDVDEAYAGPTYTDPHHRNKGLAKFLVARKVDLSLSDGIKHLYGSCNSRNYASIAYSIKSGYEIIGCIRKRKYGKKKFIDFQKSGLIREKVSK